MQTVEFQYIIRLVYYGADGKYSSVFNGLGSYDFAVDHAVDEVLVPITLC